MQDVLAGEYRDTDQELLEAMLLKGLTLENMTQRLAWLNAQRWATSVVRNIPGSEERPEWLAIKILFSCYRRPENSLKLAFDSVSDYVSGASDIEAIQNAFFGGVLSPEDRLLKLFFHRLSPEEIQSKMTVLSEDPSKAAIIAGILENPQTLQAHVFTTLQKCADGSSMPFDSYRRLEQAAIWMRCSVSALYHAVSKRPCESDSALLLDVFFAGLTLDNVADRFSNMGQLGMWASHALRQILTDESGDDRIQAFQALYTYFQDPVALTRKQSVTLEVAFDCFIPPCGSSLHLSRALGRTIEMDQEQLVTKFFTGLTLDNLKVRLKNLQKLKEGKGNPALQEAFALIIEAPNNDEQKGIKGLWECYKDPSLVEQRSHVQFLNSAATQFEPAVELRDLQAYLKDPAAFTTEQATLPVTTFLSRIGTDVFDELVTTRQGPQPQAGAAEGTNQAWRRHVMNMPAHIRRVGYGKPIFLDDPASSSTLASGLYQRQIGAMDNILAFYQIRMTFHRTFEHTETAGRKPHPLRNKVAHYSFFALEAARKDLLGGLAQLENQSREKRVNNIDCWRYDNYFKASPLPETVEAAESTVKLRLAILSYCYEELLHSNSSEEKHAQLMAGIEGALVDIAMLFQLPTLAFDHQPDAASGCSRAVTAISPKFLELWKEFNPRLTDIRNSHCHATTIASEGPGTEKRGSSVSEEAIIKCVEDLVGWSTSQKVLTLHDWQLCPSTHSASQAVQVLEERLIQLSGLAAQYSSTLVTGQTWTPTQNQAVTPCITDIQSSIAIIKQYCAVHGLGEWNEAVTWPDNEHIALIITDIVNSTDAMGNIVFNQEEYVLSVCQGLNVQEDLKMKASWLPDQEDLPPVQAEPPHVAAIAAPVMEAFQLPPLASIGVGVPAVQPPAV